MARDIRQGKHGLIELPFISMPQLNCIGREFFDCATYPRESSLERHPWKTLVSLAMSTTQVFR